MSKAASSQLLAPKRWEDDGELFDHRSIVRCVVASECANFLVDLELFETFCDLSSKVRARMRFCDPG